MARKRKNETSNGVMEADPIEVESGGLDAPEVEADEPSPAAEVPMPGPVERPEPPRPSDPEPEPDPFLSKLVERQREADAIHADYLVLSERAKERKKQWEAKQEEVASLIRRSSKPMPLFEKPAAEPFEADDEPEIDGAATILQIASGTEADREGWKFIGVAELVEHGMPKKYVGILAESNVHTIGDIQALGEKRLDLTDLKGVGESARDKIYDALESFWEAHPEHEDQIKAEIVASDAAAIRAAFERSSAIDDAGPSHDEIDPERGDD